MVEDRLWAKPGILRNPTGSSEVGRPSVSDDFRLLDHDVISGHVLMEAAIAGRNRFDLVDHLAPLHDIAEHAITKAVGIGGAEIQEIIVDDVEEELRGGGMRVRCARHRYGVRIVFDPIGRLVLDWRAHRLLLEPRLETAALHHETVDHAMKDRIVVKTVSHVLKKILRGHWRLLGVELDDYVAHRGL